MTSLPSTPTATSRIHGPAELLQAVPYLLGFHPSASLVLVGLADGLLVVTARLDLLDLTVDDLLPGTVAALARGGSTDLIGVVYDDGDDPPESWAALGDHVGAAATGAGCDLVDLLVVARGRWWSALCTDPDCCPHDGEPLPSEPSEFAAAATVAGVAPLADRTALEALLDPVAPAARVPGALLDAAERAEAVAAPDGGAERHRAAEARELLVAAFAAYSAYWAAPTDDEAARFAVALLDTATRDDLWLRIDHGTLDGRPLWRDLARRLPDPYRAAALFLFGWASWRSGNGALAGIAALRAVESDPGYTAADLLQAAVSQGVDPRAMAPLEARPRDGAGRPRGDRPVRKRGRTRDR